MILFIEQSYIMEDKNDTIPFWVDDTRLFSYRIAFAHHHFLSFIQIFQIGTNIERFPISEIK